MPTNGEIINKELVVISAVLKDGDYAYLAQSNAEQYFTTHLDVFQWLFEYYQKNHVSPPANIVEREFGVQIVDPDLLASTKHHLDELKNLWLRNKTREILHNAAEKLQDGELADAINGLVSGTSDLKRTTSDMRDLNIVDVDDAIEHFKLVKKLHDMGNYGVTVGIPGIDDMLPSGIIPGMLGLILGYPSKGKSWLSTLMAVNAWDRGKRVLYISLEMMEADVRARMYTIAGKGKWAMRDLQRGHVDVEEFETWASECFAGKNEFPIVSNDGYGPFTPTLLRAKIEQYRPDVVFVDYLQLMSPDAGGEGETVKLKTLSRELKMLAMSSGTPIIGVVSATPADATDLDGIPELGQIAWSRQLAYDADFVLAVGRATNSPLLGVAFRKNRSGPLYDFTIECDFNRGIFTYGELDFDL